MVSYQVSSNGLALDLVSSAESGNNIAPCNHPCQVDIIILIFIMIIIVITIWRITVGSRFDYVHCAVKTKSLKDNLNLNPVTGQFPQNFQSLDDFLKMPLLTSLQNIISYSDMQLNIF